ncbi:MAG: hypothetical protein HC815_19440 [Richelia sp. RM1_1_1]|nr:hypothetical protein [Richelia sp. RM1_1_1]
MTLRENVDSTSFECKGKVRKRLLLRFPIDSAQLIINSGNNDFLDLFETTKFDDSDTDDYIYLKLFPEYDSETEQLGNSNFKTTFNQSAITAASQVRRGFKATVIDKRAIILDLIFYLSLISKSTSFTRYHPVKIIDFCRPEILDNFVINSEKATIRYGGLSLEEMPPVIQIREAEYVAENWQFSFQESKLRLL